MTSKEKRKEYSRLYYLKNKEKIREYDKEFKEKNKDKIIERQKKYYLENRDKIIQRQRDYHKLTSEINKEKCRKYRETHKEFLKYCPNRYTEIENYELAKEYNFKGWCCHHKLGEHCFTKEELIKFDLYYNSSPHELIFLPSNIKLGKKHNLITHAELHHKKES